MKCFYHPDTDGVGICQQCGKSACRGCIEDIDGAMLCKGCIAREQAVQQEIKAQTKQERLTELAVTKVRAAKRIRWSWIIAILAELFYGSMVWGAAQQHVALSIPWFVLIIGGPYVLWSIYWGLIWYWPHWRRFVQRVKYALSGWILIAKPFTWLILFIFYITFYLSIPLAVAIYYGVFGGGIYQFLKHRRIASGEETEEPTAAGRARSIKIVGIVVLILAIGFSLSVWQQYRRISEQNTMSAGMMNISDGAHVLDTSSTSKLAALCNEASKKYQVQIMVVTKPTVGKANIQNVAQSLMPKSESTGVYPRAVVIVVAVQDHKWWIESNQNLANTLTSATLHDIGHRAVPLLKKADYGGAISSMVQGILDTLQRDSANVPVHPVSISSGSVVPANASGAAASDHYVIHTPKGDVAVLDFRKNPVAITDDKQTITIANTNDFLIDFNVGDTSFSIGINDKPFPVLRKRAEAAFLKALGISQTDACKLKAYEGTTFRVDPQYAGKSYALSFCKPGTP